MRKLLAATVLSTVAVLSAPANAGDGIRGSLESRPEISNFYSALVNTGVINELDPNKRYTILAPVNSAWDKYPSTQYPCLYTDQCKAETAAILRNHIVEGEVNLEDQARQNKGLYSIDQRSVGVMATQKHNFSIDGYKVVDRTLVMSGAIIEIDGVIATEQEIATVTNLKHIPTVVENEATQHGDSVVQTTTQKIIDPVTGKQEVIRKTMTTTSPAVIITPDGNAAAATTSTTTTIVDRPVR